MSRLAGFLAAGVILVLIGMMIGRTLNDKASPVIGLPEEGKPLPSFTLLTLESEEVSLKDYRGKPLFINFWATWCPPCRAEMPEIQAVRDEFKDEINVLMINQAEPSPLITKFMEANNLDLPVALDMDAELSMQWGINYLPTSMFVDAKGNLCRMHVGELNREMLLWGIKEARAGC